MKPISTTYAGYNFRSRLEARWAVFFDSLGIPYTYEAEGYDLSGLRYLPDFVIHPATNPVYCEIKPPGAPTFNEHEKARKLSHESGHAVYILCGDPYAVLVSGVSVAWGYRGVSIGRDAGDSLARVLIPGYSRQVIEAAANAARAARFEHGETPRAVPVIPSKPNRVYDGPVIDYVSLKERL